MSVTVSSCQHRCILHLHPTHACNNYIRSFAMSFTVAPTNSHVCLTCAYRHTCLIHLHTTNIHICIAISNHLCCPLHLHQTNIVVMFVTIAQDQQVFILQLHPTSSQDGKNIYAACRYLTLMLLVVLIHCTP